MPRILAFLKAGSQALLMLKIFSFLVILLLCFCISITSLYIQVWYWVVIAIFVHSFVHLWNSSYGLSLPPVQLQLICQPVAIDSASHVLSCWGSHWGSHSFSWCLCILDHNSMAKERWSLASFANCVFCFIFWVTLKSGLKFACGRTLLMLSIKFFSRCDRKIFILESNCSVAYETLCHWVALISWSLVQKTNFSVELVVYHQIHPGDVEVLKYSLPGLPMN